MSADCPWNEYPRPDFKRNSFICLNGKWDFSVSRTQDKPTEYELKILVPFPPESPLSGIENGIERGEVMHYRTFFDKPVITDERIILNLGAVDQICDIYVNDENVMHHEGGYLPFFVDITDKLNDGKNELYIKVIDNLDIRFPYGKQKANRGGMWYTPVSGIWQTVWIECVPAIRIEEIKITPSTESVTIKVKSDARSKRLTLSHTDEIFEFEGDEITLTPSDVRLWTPENPFLYFFTVEAGEDKVESYFALREISVGKHDGIDRILLNGKPYLFNGLLDQGYYPDGLFLPATSDGYRDDILLAKSLGFNTLRKHIKIEPPIFYYLCDKLGIAVFQDMVNNSDYSFLRDTALPTIGLKRISDKRLHKIAHSRKIFEDHARATVELLYNHPSIVYYTIFNEGWGQFCADDMYLKVKEWDSTRVIDSTSGWFTQRLSDVDSEHVYFKKIKLKENYERPVVISEFGGYSLREDGHLFGDKNYGYKSFDNNQAFESAVARLYLEEVAPLIEEGVSALIYTQLSDIEDETNGFITYDRKKLKVNAVRIKKVMDLLFTKL